MSILKHVHKIAFAEKLVVLKSNFVKNEEFIETGQVRAGSSDIERGDKNKCKTLITVSNFTFLMTEGQTERRSRTEVSVLRFQFLSIQNTKKAVYGILEKKISDKLVF